MLKYMLVLLALAGATFGLLLAFRQPPALAEGVPGPRLDPPVKNPYHRAIAGAGIVEPKSENVVVGSPEPGVVQKVFVTKGQAVKKGQPLFSIDARVLEHQLPVLQADVLAAERELERTRAFRRREDEPLLRAKVAAAEASIQEAAMAIRSAKMTAQEREWDLKDLQSRQNRLETTVKAGASPEEELDRARFAVAAAEARLAASRENILGAEAAERAAVSSRDQAKAELDTFLAGAWEPDVKRAEAAVAVATAKVEQVRAEIARRTVTAPIDGSVIRLNLREGEYTSGGQARAEDAPVVLGNLDAVHVRVDIDEFDASKFKPEMKAQMYLRSDRERAIPLEFVSVEPFIIPKRALTNSQRELVDTRVLQVIYRIAGPQNALYVGQQVDVFFELPAAAANP